MRKINKNPLYVFHFCKNPQCNSGWIDEDLTNAKSYPPNWKYCQQCCEKYGYRNHEKPPERELSKKQKAVLRKHQFYKREKASKLNEIDKDDRNG